MALHKLATYISTLLPLNYRWNNRAGVARSQNRFPSRPLCRVLRQIAQPNVKHRPFGLSMLHSVIWLSDLPLVMLQLL